MRMSRGARVVLAAAGLVVPAPVEAAAHEGIVVTAEPATGLVDFQVIQVTGAPGACVIDLAMGLSDRPDRFARAPLAFAAAPSPPTTTPTPEPPAPAPPAVPVAAVPTFTG